MNKVQALLKKGKLTGEEVGKLIVKNKISQIAGVRDGKDGSLFSNEELSYLCTSFPATKQNIDAYNTYLLIEHAITNTYNYTQAMTQQIFHGFYKYLGEAEKIMGENMALRSLKRAPLPLTENEENSLKAMSIKETREKDVSEAELFLKTIKKYASDYYSKGIETDKNIAMELDKVKDKPIENERILRMAENLDTVTAGGVRIGVLHDDYNEKELYKEARENLYKHFNVHTDKALTEKIFNRAMNATYDLFSDFEKIASAINKDKDQVFFITTLAMKLRDLLFLTAPGVVDGLHDIAVRECIDSLIEHYIDEISENNFRIIKNEIKSARDYFLDCYRIILGFDILTLKRLPYERIKCEDVLIFLFENYGDSQKSFDEFKKDFPGVYKAFKEEATIKEWLKQFGTAKSGQEFSTTHKLGDIIDARIAYGSYMLDRATSNEAITGIFQRENPEDIRTINDRLFYSVARAPKKELLRIYEKFSDTSLDRINKNEKDFENVKNALTVQMAPACRFLLSIVTIFDKLANIYNVPELKDMGLFQLNPRHMCKSLSIQLTSLLCGIEGTYAQVRERQKTALSFFHTLRAEDIEPDIELINMILKPCNEDPFSEKARYTLDTLVYVLNGLALDKKDRKDYFRMAEKLGMYANKEFRLDA